MREKQGGSTKIVFFISQNFLHRITSTIGTGKTIEFPLLQNFVIDKILSSR